MRKRLAKKTLGDPYAPPGRIARAEVALASAIRFSRVSRDG